MGKAAFRKVYGRVNSVGEQTEQFSLTQDSRKFNRKFSFQRDIQDISKRKHGRKRPLSLSLSAECAERKRLKGYPQNSGHPDVITITEQEDDNKDGEYENTTWQIIHGVTLTEADRDNFE